jgi:hypothetical protein
MIKFFITTCALVLTTTSTFASNWVRVTEQSVKGRVLELDRTSITKLQGIVVFKIRDRGETKADSFSFYDQLFLLCSNREVGIISMDMIWDDSKDLPKYQIHPSEFGPAVSGEHQRAARHPLIVEACKRSNSKLNVEIPIARTNDFLMVFLPAETRLTASGVAVWTKYYPITQKTQLKPDGSPLYKNADGTPLSHWEFKNNDGHELVNWVADCKEETSAVAARHRYGADGQVKSSISITREKLQFTSDPPQSAARKINEIACNLR